VTARALPGAAAKASVLGVKYEGTVGQLPQQAVDIKVVDRTGNAVPDVPLTLEPQTGSVSDSVVTTDSTGRAKLPWTMGHTVGAQHLRVRIEGIDKPIEISARARAGGAANLAFVTPKPGTAARAVQSLDVDLTDAYGNAVADQPVVFSTKSGNVSPARVMTDARGRAHTRWTPGSKTGERTLLAVVKGTEARASFVL
jgi:adhesin/invasin